MLSVESPRWANIKTGFGTGESTARALKRVHECIVCDPVDVGELKAAIYEVQCECDELYHQQSVYPATAATVPHLVYFLPYLPIKERVAILCWVGLVAYEGPDRNVDEDIAEWYRQSVSAALHLALELAKGKDGFSSDHMALFATIAILWDGGSLYYTFRDFHQYEFECAHCRVQLLCGFEESHGYKVWKASDGICQADIDDSLIVPVPSVGSLEEELARPEHDGLRFFHGLFLEGEHQFMLDWEKRVLGRFLCPGCNKSIPIKYRWGS